MPAAGLLVLTLPPRVRHSVPHTPYQGAMTAYYNRPLYGGYTPNSGLRATKNAWFNTPAVTSYLDVTGSGAEPQ